LELKLLDRIRNLRAGLLLALSSAVIFLPVSYWMPFPEYFGTLASEEYADYQLALRSIVAIYLVFLVLNIFTAALSATKLDYRVKFWLSLTPAAILLIAPFLLLIPAALKFSDRNYFEVFQAMYRLLRFSSPLLITIALASTLVAVAINIRAALIFRAAIDPGAIPAQVRKRYFIYGGVVLLMFAVIVPVGAYNGALRSADRRACNDYAALEIPKVDADVPQFLSSVRVFGDEAGNQSLKDAFINFSDLSRELLSMLGSDNVDSITLDGVEASVAKAKRALESYCSEYGVR